MKIRTGFVSNSSSSSFAIDVNSYRNTKDLALTMIKIRDEDWNNYEDKPIGHESEEYKLLYKTKKLPCDNITFQTTNYDTYIVKHHKVYLVDTCNNTDWSSLEIEDAYGEESPNSFSNIINSSKYWNLKWDLINKQITYDDDKYDFDNNYCQKHTCYKIKINNDVICPKCEIDNGTIDKYHYKSLTINKNNKPLNLINL